jgi:hypothetical protein
MIIKNTSIEAQCPWPDTIDLVQGGRSGLVIRPASSGGNYTTAFVEVFSPEGGFIRGEGETVAEAETAAWKKYNARAACTNHEYEARNYKNGAGFCKHCNKFASKVFTPEEIGCLCKVCNVGTFWSRIDNDFYCEEHATDRDTLWLKRQRLKETAGTDVTVTGSKLGDILAMMREEIE